MYVTPAFRSVFHLTQCSAFGGARAAASRRKTARRNPTFFSCALSHENYSPRGRSPTKLTLDDHFRKSLSPPTQNCCSRRPSSQSVIADHSQADSRKLLSTTALGSHSRRRLVKLTLGARPPSLLSPAPHRALFRRLVTTHTPNAHSLTVPAHFPVSFSTQHDELDLDHNSEDDV